MSIWDSFVSGMGYVSLTFLGGIIIYKVAVLIYEWLKGRRK